MQATATAQLLDCVPVEGSTILGGTGSPCSSVSRANLKMKSKVLVVTLRQGGNACEFLPLRCGGNACRFMTLWHGGAVCR